MPMKQYQKYLVTAVPILLVLLVGYYFFDIVTYVILAWILSMIGAPLHNKLRQVIGNTGGALVTLLSFFIFTMALVWLFVPPIVQQARNFATIDYEEVLGSLEEPINDWNEWLIDKGILEEQAKVDTTIDSIKVNQPPLVEVIRLDTVQSSIDSIRDNITILVQVNHPTLKEESNGSGRDALMTDSYLDRVRKNLIGFLNPSRISQVLTTIFGALGNTLIGVMSVFFITFFFLKDKGLFNQIVSTLSPNDKEEKWATAIDSSAEMLKRYFIGMVVQIIIITIFVSTILSLLGFQNALLIGFFAALMNVIPYLGPILGAAFAIIITISSNLDVSFYDTLLPQLGILVLVFAAMQMFDNFLVQPNVFSKSVKAHPLEIFIIILVGAKLGGVLGMVIAIPLYTILRVIAKLFLSEFKIVQRITQDL